MNDVLPKPRTGLAVRCIDGETVILNRATDEIHTLNESASFVWAQLDGKTEPEHIVQALVTKYSVDPTTAENDVSTIVEQFRTLELIDN